MEREIREVVLLSVSLLLLATVLTFIVILTGIREDAAYIRNNAVTSRQAIERYRTYNEYESDILNGPEVIECVLNNYTGDVPIFINYRTNVATSEIVNKSNVVRDERDRIIDDPRVFSEQQYILHPEYFKVAVTDVVDADNVIQNWFGNEYKYVTTLLYNGQKPDELNTLLSQQFIIKGGAEMVDRQQRIELIQSILAENITYGDISGIFIVDADNVG